VGIERAVTRWYLQRQAYKNEIALLEAKLAQMQTGGQESEGKERADAGEQLVNTQTRLRTLGPCPKAMMG
jgi:hypothetical protein